jgi:GTP-binding protein HflX
VVEADLLLHVVDLSHPDHEEQIDAVNRTLADIGAADKPTILVYNKIDALPHEEGETEAQGRAVECKKDVLFISAAKKLNIDTLRDTLYNEVSRIHAIRYPYNNFLY